MAGCSIGRYWRSTNAVASGVSPIGPSRMRPDTRAETENNPHSPLTRWSPRMKPSGSAAMGTLPSYSWSLDRTRSMRTDLSPYAVCHVAARRPRSARSAANASSASSRPIRPSSIARSARKRPRSRIVNPRVEHLSASYRLVTTCRPNAHPERLSAKYGSRDPLILALGSSRVKNIARSICRISPPPPPRSIPHGACFHATNNKCGVRQIRTHGTTRLTPGILRCHRGRVDFGGNPHGPTPHPQLRGHHLPGAGADHHTGVDRRAVGADG